MHSSKCLILLVFLLAGGFAVAMAGYLPGQAAAVFSEADVPFEPAGDSEKHGFDVSGMDPSVSACANFFQYANGGWVAKNPIPAAYPSWGRF